MQVGEAAYGRLRGGENDDGWSDKRQGHGSVKSQQKE
jgi:hypothetical protein